jgi:myo-inositol-1(or 4)-monophosphatase
MTAPHLAADLEIARDAALLAGEAVMRHFRRGEPVHFKSADQPVTAADLVADRILRERLLAERPGYGWLSEETIDDPERLARDRVWIVDPIDGTNSFVAGLPEFVISVALAERGEPVVGVIHNPATGELYHAVRGGGAYLAAARIRVAAPPLAGTVPVLLASRAEEAAGAFAELEGRWEVRLLGSTAYRMVRVADGSAQATFSARAKSDWDVCAAALIVMEAGGSVGDARGAPLVFNLPVPAHQGVRALASGRLPALPAPTVTGS